MVTIFWKLSLDGAIVIVSKQYLILGNSRQRLSKVLYETTKYSCYRDCKILYLSAKISKIVFVKVLKMFDLYNKTRSRMLGIDLNFESLRRYNPIVRFSPIIE